MLLYGFQEVLGNFERQSGGLCQEAKTWLWSDLPEVIQWDPKNKKQ